MENISPALQTRINNHYQIGVNNTPYTTAPKVDLTQKPDTFERSSGNAVDAGTNKTDKKKKIAKIAIVAAAVTTAGVLLIRHKLSVDKAKKLAQETAEAARKNTEIENIFKNVKGVPDHITGEKVSVDELIQKYLHDYDMTGKTLYHGTGYETAEIIKKNGIKESIRGDFLDKFQGGFFSEELETAQRYAKQAARQGKTLTGVCSAPIKVTAGGVVQATLPNGSKLAQFTNEEGKFISIDLLEDIIKTPEMSDAIKNANLKKSDVVKYLQNLLTEKGYDGIRHYEVHTGATPIIFNRDKLIYGDIIKI